jgi:hypothetical protein
MLMCGDARHEKRTRSNTAWFDAMTQSTSAATEDKPDLDFPQLVLAMKSLKRALSAVPKLRKWRESAFVEPRHRERPHETEGPVVVEFR